MKQLLLALVLGLLPLPVSVLCAAEPSTPTGSLQGQVTDAETKQPVIGAAIVIKGTQLGAAADLDGHFTIENVSVGAYAMQISAIGFEPVVMTDVIIRSGRATLLTIELRVLALESSEVTVRPTYFTQPKDAPANTTVLSYEEIRRSPGAVGDVSRIIMSLPSVAKVNDTRNSLVVRGGSPMENGYSLDGIEVPNINHFPLQGAASGALGMVNVDLIEDVTFQAGGFGVADGDKLSSVMDIDLRDGDRTRFNGQANFSFLGIGGVVEGPAFKDNGSWMVAANRSYFDFIIDGFDIEASAIPWYSDVLGKVVYDASPRSRFTVLDLAGVDHSHIARSRALDNEENVYGTADWTVNTLGANWRYLWGNRGYSNTSVSHTYTNWQSDWRETVGEDRLSENKSTENTFTLSSEHFSKLGARHNLAFGATASAIPFDYDRTLFATTDVLGNPVSELIVRQSDTALKLGAYLNYSWLVSSKLTATPGLRLDHFDYNENTTVSPRLQLAYSATRETSFNVSYGLYRQSLPLVLLSQNQDFLELRDPDAVHYVVGVSHLLNDETRLTIEAYHKDYSHLPLDPSQPQFSVIDQTNDQDGFTTHDALEDNGRAYTSGVEVMLQKKLVERFYGSVSGSYYRSRYRDHNDIWRDRIYDNRYLFTLVGGYKPNSKWDLSLRWIYAGGAPYTPFDVAQSTSANRGIYAEDRVNTERLPEYHTLDVRVDRRFNLASSNWVLYLSIQNLYGRENIASYYWNQVKNKQSSYKQWGTLPILGLEFEF